MWIDRKALLAMGVMEILIAIYDFTAPLVGKVVLKTVFFNSLALAEDLLGDENSNQQGILTAIPPFEKGVKCPLEGELLVLLQRLNIIVSVS